MDLRIEPYTESHVPGVRAFNKRLREGKAAYVFSEQAPPPIEPENELIRQQSFVVLDGQDVRGGFILISYPGCFAAGENAPVLNCRLPISEGIVNPKYSLLGLRILKHIQKQSPYVFALGMGGEQLAFPRLLRGAGWTLRPVPFLFWIVHARQFLSELPMLQQPLARRMLARFAGITGIGEIGTAILHARSIFGQRSLNGLRIERVSEWGTWADEIWAQFRGLCSFTIARDRRTLSKLYPLSDPQTLAFLIRRGEHPVAWVAALNNQMHNHHHFGNMRVATVLDCATTPDEMAGTAALATQELARAGADLVVTNQSHEAWVKAFKQVGFFESKSNYILGLSKDLALSITKKADGLERVHFTRGDSDGRIHL
jgi:hypothetical protein